MKEDILNIMEDIHEAKEAMQINDMLKLKTASEYQILTSSLDELVAENTMYLTKKNRYMLLKNCTNLLIGKLTVNKKGFGFVIIEKADDLYISADNMGDAIDGDIVLCEVIAKKIKKEGKILKVVKRDINNLVGEAIKDGDQFRLDLDDKKKDLEIILSKESSHFVVEGHKLLAKISQQVTKNSYIADVIKIIGHKDDPGIDILSVAYKHGFYEDFGPNVEEELKEIPAFIQEKDTYNRRDLRNETIFTIDGADTKDIDDAISVSYENGIYTLGVHIADVSHYVKENTALGDQAYERGTSAYLADTVIPMIPHQLSNGICSLNPNVDRLAVSCEMKINETGNIIEHDIFLSVINSKIKMTYKAVNDILIRNKVAEGYEPYEETLRLMEKLHKVLRENKKRRGYIDFDLDEAKAIQNEKGVCIDIIKRTRETGEVLIEDFMIAANEAVATHIFNMDLPFIYRVHGDPKEEKVQDFLNLVKVLGYKVEGNTKDLTSKTMQNILKQLKDKKEFTILSSLLLRSMRKAEYSKDNIGHFGLASRIYTHFTSPIRRYPDLVVHRLLKRYLIDNDYSKPTITELETSLINIATHTSEREVEAIESEREVMDMKTAEYMESHIGEEYEGMITSITNFGMFVELPNLIEGLVHISTLKGDYYNYIEEILAMVGKSTKKQYRLGDIVKVKVVSANKHAGTVDFEIIEEKKENKDEKENKDIKA